MNGGHLEQYSLKGREGCKVLQRMKVVGQVGWVLGSVFGFYSVK